MERFCQAVPRLLVVALAVGAFCVVPPETFARGPALCVWRHLLRAPACPTCGTIRALAAFFHGHLLQAVGYNRNVVVTGPLLVGVLVYDIVRGICD